MLSPRADGLIGGRNGPLLRALTGSASGEEGPAMPPQSDDDLQELVERLRSENASLRARAEATPPGEEKIREARTAHAGAATRGAGPCCPPSSLSSEHCWLPSRWWRIGTQPTHGHERVRRNLRSARRDQPCRPTSPTRWSLRSRTRSIFSNSRATSSTASLISDLVLGRARRCRRLRTRRSRRSRHSSGTRSRISSRRRNSPPCGSGW